MGDAADCARRLREYRRRKVELRRVEDEHRARRELDLQVRLSTLETAANDVQERDALRECVSIVRELHEQLQCHLDATAVRNVDVIRLISELERCVADGRHSAQDRLSMARQARSCVIASIRTWDELLGKAQRSQELWLELASDITVLYEILGEAPPIDLTWRSRPADEQDARLEELAWVKAEALLRIQYQLKSGPDHIRTQELALQKVADQIAEVLRNHHLELLGPTGMKMQEVACNRALYRYSDNLALEVTLVADGNCGFEFVRLANGDLSGTEVGPTVSMHDLRAVLRRVLEDLNAQGLGISIHETFDIPMEELNQRTLKPKGTAISSRVNQRPAPRKLAIDPNGH